MFGKNYDEQISKLIKVSNNLVETNRMNVKEIDNLRDAFNNLQKLFGSMQENILGIAKIQSQHKSAITFLINHASVDADAQEDLFKMLKEIKQINDDVEKKTKKLK